MWRHSAGEPWFAGQAWRHRCRDWTRGRGGGREAGWIGRLGPTYTVCEREGRRGSGGTSGWVRTEGVHEEGPDVCIVARQQKLTHTVKQLYFN